MRLLVLTSEPITAAQLREAVKDGVKPEDVEVMVIAPALQDDALHFWLSDADDAIARAEEVRRRTAAQLDRAGIPVSTDTGESDPQQAIADALMTFRADRIVLFEHPPSEQRYREAVDVAEIQQRFGLPADRATVT
jgi:nucleotide-binding universal stress UspA family protein